jgi:membrane-bound lytic murein transglycosylase B
MSRVALLWWVLGGAAVLPTDAGLDLLRPETWRLSARLPPASRQREALLAAWTRDAGTAPTAVGEVALSRSEAEALLADPRAELVYGEKTVSILAPSMKVRQRQDHLELLQAFLVPERIAAGAAFARAHAEVLERASSRHQVEPEAIVAILMWETRLGTVTGDWLAFNAFTSQAFFAQAAADVALLRPGERALGDRERQRKRAEQVRARAYLNLVALVRQCKAKGMDPLAVKGSWAGALGYPQFMPASLRWAEDGDADGRIDLFDFDDAIASVARYLEAHGWARSQSRAVWAYNHEDAYVQGVLAYAAALGGALHPIAGGAPDGGLAGGPASLAR